MNADEARELRETFQRGLERIHERLDMIDARLSDLPRLDERTVALRADIDRHDSCISALKSEHKELRDRTSWVSKVGIGGGVAGGGAVLIELIKQLAGRP